MRLIQTMEKFREIIKEKDIVIFGVGEFCMRFLNRLEAEEISCIKYIVDSNVEKQGSRMYGIPVRSPEMIRELEPSNTVIVIALFNGIPEVYSYISELGDYTIASARILINDILSQVAVTLYENKDKVEQVTDLLYDDKSKLIYSEVIKRRMLYGECDFSDLIVRGDAEYRVPILYENSIPKNEIVIDCGAYNGDTLKKFADTYGSKLKKIYVFECMEESICDLSLAIAHVQNKKIFPEIKLMPYALSDQDCVMKFAKTIKPNGSFLVENREFANNALYESEYVDVNVTYLDKVIPKDEKITFIKMDIEGSEFAALHGAEEIIKTYKPRLAISIYHCGEDYYRIPLYLKKLVPEYKLIVRHHNKNHCDTDLYCWIEEQ
jgi:FkbM family methyltransferase